MKNPQWLARVLAVLFLLFIIFIIITADLGFVYQIFGFLIDYPYGDAVAHCILMGIMAMLANLAFPLGRFKRPPLLKTSLIMFAIVLLEEISQLFLQNRTFSLIDLSADIIGIGLLGELGAWLHARFLSKKSQVTYDDAR